MAPGEQRGPRIVSKPPMEYRYVYGDIPTDEIERRYQAALQEIKSRVGNN